ncbi:MAG: glycosyltransferase [Actinomycetota bacterium]
MVGDAAGCAADWRARGPLLDTAALNRDLLIRAMGAVGGRLGKGAWLRQRALLRFLRQHGVEVVLGEYLDSSLAWLELTQRAGLRFFAHAHGYDVSLCLRDPEWRARYKTYNRADGIITMSHVSKERLCGLGISPEKIHVIPYGVDVPANAPVKTPHSLRCVAVGRMVAKKAPILLLDAFRRASQSNPDLRLDYVGDGPLLPAARQFVHAFRLEERVTLHGSQPNTFVQELLRSADLFLQHSATDPDTGDEEGLPVAILEAMAHGTPVVSTLHAGIPEAVTDGESGFLVAEGDSAAMSERLSALAQDSRLRAAMGAAAWARARERFTWDREREELLRVLGLTGSQKAVAR